MGQLVEYPIKTLFNGVSRQPHPVRLPSQIEEGDNILTSVVSGGFEKRPATQHLATIASLDAEMDYAFHVIDRDQAERYCVVVGNDDLKVFDLFTGTEKTVAFPDGKTYLVGLQSDFAFTTVADYTFIVNRTVTVAMSTATTGTVSGTKQTFSDLPAASSSSGQIWKVAGDPSSGFDDYYVVSDGSVWTETVNPNGQNDFDAATMPHQLVRETDGTFTFKKATWSSRGCGDEDSVPPPLFVGKTISDVFFHRGRLGLLADETVFFFQAGDTFNGWPEKAFQQLDTDPVELSASTNKVTILRHATPFRKSLFVTADAVQFEVTTSDERLTPQTAVIDVTTSYQIDPLARPVTMGDQLYFAGSAQGYGVVYEYFYDGDAFSNEAADITKHCFGYLPSNLRQITASSLAGRTFYLPDLYRNYVYVYASYWAAEEKVQSSWTRYVFGATEFDAYVYGIAVVQDTLYMLVARGGDVCLESMPVEPEANDEALGFAPLYDRRVSLTGVYDEPTNTTTWTLPYTHNDDVKVMLGGDFTNQQGRILNVTYPTSTTVAASGDFSAGEAYLGIEYEMRAELSRQFLRDEQGAAVKTGRLQLRHFSFNYKNTGYFEVHVTPESRDTKVWKMTGRIIGAASNVIGTPSIVEQGNYRVRVGSRGDTCKIEVVNSSPYPCVITGASWAGFYNNVVRQG